MNDWVIDQATSTRHKVAIYLFAFIVFLSYVNPLFAAVGLVFFFLVTSFKMLKKMLLFMLIIGGISVALPFLAPIVLIIMIVLFFMRISYVIKNWKPFIAGLLVYGSAALVISRTISTNLYSYGFSWFEPFVVSVIAFFMLNAVLKWLYRNGYSSFSALGIMGSVPLIIISFVLPFLKIHIGGLDGTDGGIHTTGDGFTSPDGHVMHAGETGNGTTLQHVKAHVRTAPDGDPTNNLSYHGSDAKPPDTDNLVYVKDYVRTVPDGNLINNLSHHGAEAVLSPGQHWPHVTQEKAVEISQKAVVGQAAVDSLVRELKKQAESTN
ncbi:hypothetical protein [Falsibacillus albus]|uniref:Uncharacterized protein n=1 Tax=Falsibacillus albus TaxID=2478915 RepID=A0A3L7JWI9_9BACI|nr:hypothetical protein [Falsibacillus albus]RLQ94890.1 hypothetical protein D9X91_12980 [Falsibacillus albus]